MKLLTPFILVLAAWLLSGCAVTEIRDPQTGRVIARIQADASNVDFKSPNVSFHADSLDHSTPTLAQGKATSSKFEALGSALMAFFLLK